MKKQCHLPINFDDLLHRRVVESDRIEYKAGWNPDPIVRTLCAFANDYENLGGGYVIVGQDCDAETGLPNFPPVGLSKPQVDRIQRELLQYCNLIEPKYFPLMETKEVGKRTILVLWAPGGQNRPYRAPKEVTSKQKAYAYYIRKFANTVEARGPQLHELMSLTATVPFDDRIRHDADLEDLRIPLIRSYLKEVKSELYTASAKLSIAELARQMNICDGGSEYVKPRNVGLMFFHDTPEKFFPGSHIDLVLFPKGPGGGELIEKKFQGPLHQQLRDALRYIQNNVIKERITKLPGQAEAKRIFNFPYGAVEEALVNAVYHRSYELPDPVEVRVDPEGLEILSFPGPDEYIRVALERHQRIVGRRYRNRRIGDFLKELKLTEGRSTGIPTMQTAMLNNGSPPPEFKTDEDRKFFVASLPINPAFKEAHDEAHDKAHDKAHDEAHVKAHDRAHDGAHVEAHDKAHDGAHVKAHDRAHDGAHVEAHDRAHDGAHVEAHDEAHVKAHDKAHDEAHDKKVKRDHDVIAVMNATEKHVLRVLLAHATNRAQIAKELRHPGRGGNLLRAISRLRTLGLIELTVPEKPRSRNQMLRLTNRGVATALQVKGAKKAQS